ncbi:MAG: hypothetical protein WC853_08615 [Thermodesulfovibrionales bacterium]
MAPLIKKGNHLVSLVRMNAVAYMPTTRSAMPIQRNASQVTTPARRLVNICTSR